MKTWKLFAVIFVATVGMAACSSPSSTIEKETTPKVMPTHQEAKPEDTSPITLAFVGDTMMDWSVKTAINEKGAAFPFAHVKSEIQSVDYAVANLETAITTSQSLVEKQFNFKSDPKSVEGLTDTGFDLVSLANNHTMDYGRTGLLDTFRYLDEHKLPYIGAGKNEQEAYAAVTQTIRGKKVKFLAFSRVLPDGSWYATSTSPGLASAYQEENVLQVIQKEKQDADYVFVFVHWGVEKAVKPEAYQRTFAHAMIDHGADGIIGSHPHVLQGFEYYQNKPIAYSLGNFLFPSYVSGLSADTGILHLTLNGETISMSFSPYSISNNQVVKRDEAYNQKQYAYLSSLSYNARVSKDAIVPIQTQ